MKIDGGRESSPVGVAMALPSLFTEPFPVFDLKSLFRAIPPRCSTFMSQLTVQRDEGRTETRPPFTAEAASAQTRSATTATRLLAKPWASLTINRHDQQLSSGRVCPVKVGSDSTGVKRVDGRQKGQNTGYGS